MKVCGVGEYAKESYLGKTWRGLWIPSLLSNQKRVKIYLGFYECVIVGHGSGSKLYLDESVGSNLYAYLS